MRQLSNKMLLGRSRRTQRVGLAQTPQQAVKEGGGQRLGVLAGLSPILSLSCSMADACVI